ncbi:hypothetical protein AOLI_G00098470 [Acnodon oligacanthus]
MIVLDCQPLSIVDNNGFNAFIKLLDPTYIVPSRKALKEKLDKKYKVTKENAIAEMGKFSAVSLTADMWTSINMDAYLAVTCHYITDEAKLSSLLLGESVPPVPPPDVQDRSLWGLLDSHVEAEQRAPSATSSAIAEVPKRCTPVKGGGPPEVLG